jgi:glycosyltransferase involved in cell wall biosynthesis
MKKVSVVIPNYNYGRYISDAIDSAFGQTLKPHEVIVVDDGSTDDSLEVLKKFEGRITVIRQTNQRAAGARNAGAKAATGEFLAFLDADDYWHPQKLEKQIEKIEGDPEVGLVHCGMLYVDQEGNEISEHLEGQEGWVAEKLLKFQPVIIGPGSSTLVRKDVFQDVGGYDTDLQNSEDWDFSLRVAKKYKFAFVEEPLVYYRQHGSGKHSNIERMERSMRRAYDKAFSASEFQYMQRECFGNFYMIVAGSYFHAGDVPKSVLSGLKALYYNPRTIKRLAEFPLRRFRRSREKDAKFGDTRPNESKT